METIPKKVTEWVIEANGNNSETCPTQVNSSAQKICAAQENSCAKQPKQNKRRTRPMSLLVSISEFDQKIKKNEFTTEKRISIEFKSINNSIELTEANEFPDREFYTEKGEKIMSYTHILHFFESESVFKNL